VAPLHASPASSDTEEESSDTEDDDTSDDDTSDAYTSKKKDVPKRSQSKAAKHKRQRGAKHTQLQKIIIRQYYENGMIDSSVRTEEDRKTVARLTGLSLQQVAVSFLRGFTVGG
jgi:hypothetical protein